MYKTWSHVSQVSVEGIPFHHQVMSDNIDDIQDPRYHMSHRTFFNLSRTFAWAWMALGAWNASPRLLADSNNLGQGPHLRRDVRAGSLRGPEPKRNFKTWRYLRCLASHMHMCLCFWRPNKRQTSFRRLPMYIPVTHVHNL